MSQKESDQLNEELKRIEKEMRPLAERRFELKKRLQKIDRAFGEGWIVLDPAVWGERGGLFSIFKLECAQLLARNRYIRSQEKEIFIGYFLARTVARIANRGMVATYRVTPGVMNAEIGIGYFTRLDEAEAAFDAIVTNIPG